MQDEMRNRLIEMLQQTGMLDSKIRCEIAADELLSKGVIVPPCKVDDTVYVLRSGKITPMTVKYMYISHKVNRMYAENGEDHYNFRQKEIGITVFFSEEDAEKEREKNVCHLD